MDTGLEIYSHCTTVYNNDTHENGDDRQVAITLPVMGRSCFEGQSETKTAIANSASRWSTFMDTCWIRTE